MCIIIRLTINTPKYFAVQTAKYETFPYVF